MLKSSVLSSYLFFLSFCLRSSTRSRNPFSLVLELEGFASTKVMKNASGGSKYWSGLVAPSSRALLISLSTSSSSSSWISKYPHLSRPSAFFSAMLFPLMYQCDVSERDCNIQERVGVNLENNFYLSYLPDGSRAFQVRNRAFFFVQSHKAYLYFLGALLEGDKERDETFPSLLSKFTQDANPTPHTIAMLVKWSWTPVIPRTVIPKSLIVKLFFHFSLLREKQKPPIWRFLRDILSPPHHLSLAG